MPGFTELADLPSSCSSQWNLLKCRWCFWWPVAFDPASPVGTPCHLFLPLLLHLRKSRVWTAQIVARALSAKESFPWRLGFVLCAPSTEVGIAGQTLAVSRGKTRSTTAAGRDLERTRGFQSPAIAVIKAQNNAFNLQSQNIPNIDFRIPGNNGNGQSTKFL